MKSVLISIHPKWCELIASGKKTVEVRKTRPKIETHFKCYIYETKSPKLKYVWTKKDYEGYPWFADMDENEKIFCKITQGKGKVIGEFVCDRIEDMRDVPQEFTCLTVREWLSYTVGFKGIVWGWHISDLVIYDKPKELREFMKINRECWYADLGLAKRDCPECQNQECFIQRPPQSWCYVEELRKDEGK